MSAKFREMGNGSVEGGRRGPRDTQDFGNGTPEFETPLVSGSHVVASDGTITFLASFHARDGRAPGEALLELDGRGQPMTLAFGTRKSGTYRAVLRQDDECRRYRFRFRDGDGKTWLHPENGNLFTTEEGDCRREYERDKDTGSDPED